MDEGRLSASTDCDRPLRCLIERVSRTVRGPCRLRNRMLSAMLSVAAWGSGLGSLPGGGGGSLWDSGEWWMLLSAQSMAVRSQPPSLSATIGASRAALGLQFSTECEWHALIQAVCP